MSVRETTVLWLRDTLEYLSACQKQLEWTEDPETVRLVTTNMLRDLERCHRLCEDLRRRAEGMRQAV